MLTSVEVFNILGEVKYKDWTLKLTHLTEDTSILQWVFLDNGEVQECRKWVIDHRQPKSDIIRTALAAVIMAEEHEVREKFLYRGKRVFNPHYNIDRLAEISGKLENLEIPQKNEIPV